ncbi:MAG: response regulator [Proteobacteria bacterium]|nr:response regulator [Pseudomonadota bacterium]
MTDTLGHILAVDDNRMNRLKLVRMLEKEGYDVSQAEGGRKALTMLRANIFELVLLDILMPDVDGFQVLREMKQEAALRDIPVIVVTAVEDMNSVNECLELGAVDYVAKPVDAKLLIDRVCNYIKES